MAATSSRRAKIEAISSLLRRAEPPEVPVVVAFLSGELRQRPIGVGYAALRDVAGGPWPPEVIPPGQGNPVQAGVASPEGAPDGTARAPGLTVAAVDAAFTHIGAATGPGSQAERRRLLAALFADANSAERPFLTRLLVGDLRQGALEGIMVEAIAAAAGVVAGEVRRAHMLGGSLLAVASAALAPDATAPDATAPGFMAAKGAARPEADPARQECAGAENGTAPQDGNVPEGGPAAKNGTAPKNGTVPEECAAPQNGTVPEERADPVTVSSTPGAALAALRVFRLRVGRPLQPMLAGSADNVRAALGRVTPAAVEWKIDGIRVQVHKDGTDVAVFTRTLDEITARVPEVVRAVAAMPARSIVLDGEIIALGPGGRPRPFQVTAGRTGNRNEIAKLADEVPLTAFFFDLLHLDGADMVDAPGAERYTQLAAALCSDLVIPRIVTDAEAQATAFFENAVARGHEGVLVKSLDAPYAAGRRGADWIKVKPRHTLDLLVVAAEWGHGRRRDWLSNLHLAARDPGSGGHVMLGKTFKGLTDEILAWQTTRLLELADPPRGRSGSDGADAGWVVPVRPELVVEIAFDGVQASPRYPGGLALRFARVIRYRPDKRAADADTIDSVRKIADASGVALAAAVSEGAREVLDSADESR